MTTLRLLLVPVCLICLHAAAQEDTRQPQPGDWQAMRRNVVRDPFASRKKFTVDFANYADGEWCYPFPGAHVISPFGGKRHNHAGTDLKTTAGARDTLYAAFPGLVTKEGVVSGYGNFILIHHANGLATAYAHNSKNLVRQGQWVNAGQPIAIVGRTGRATTDHLHFEVRVGGRAIDSDKLFDHSKHQLRKRKVEFTKKSNGQVKVH